MRDYQHRTPMMSQGELEKKYSKIEIKPADENRVNCYVCKCGYVTKTIDIHEGVTPMFLTCDCCKGTGISTGYHDITPDKAPEYEWFVPTLQEFLKHRKSPAMIEHLLLGGLELRRIKP